MLFESWGADVSENSFTPHMTLMKAPKSSPLQGKMKTNQFFIQIISIFLLIIILLKVLRKSTKILTVNGPGVILEVKKSIQYIYVA